MAFFSSHWHGKCVQVNILHGCVFNVTNTCRCQYIIHSEPNFPMFAFEVPSFVIFAVLCILHVAPPTRILRQKHVRRPFFAHFYDARGSSINDFHTHTWEISVKYLSLILALSLQLEVPHFHMNIIYEGSYPSLNSYYYSYRTLITPFRPPR